MSEPSRWLPDGDVIACVRSWGSTSATHCPSGTQSAVTNGADAPSVPQMMMSAWMNIATGGEGCGTWQATLEFMGEIGQSVASLDHTKMASELLKQCRGGGI